MPATAELQVHPMGRKPKNSQQPARDDTSVKIDRTLYRDIRALAGFYGQDASTWLTDFLRPLIATEMNTMAEKIKRRH
jgi:hypothetical protein